MKMILGFFLIFFILPWGSARGWGKGRNLKVFSFFGRFTLNSSIPGNQTEFTKLYYLGTTDISDTYEPKNFKTYLSTHFKAVFKCLNELGLNDDVVVTFFGTKYKIHYKN